MNNFKHNKKSHFWHSGGFLIFIFFVIVVFSYNLIILVKKEKETNKKKEKVLHQIDVLKEREKVLNRDIQKLQTDEGIEESIRDKYQVVKQGEKIVSIVDQEEVKVEQIQVKEHGFWNFVKRMFKR